jgi:hypothetical protein
MPDHSSDKLSLIYDDEYAPYLWRPVATFID